MIRPTDYHKDLPHFNPGDLITFIEGDSWVFIAKDGEPRKEPPVGIIISIFDEVALKVLWSSGELTMEWRSQLQHYADYKKGKSNERN